MFELRKQLIAALDEKTESSGARLVHLQTSEFAWPKMLANPHLSLWWSKNNALFCGVGVAIRANVNGDTRFTQLPTELKSQWASFTDKPRFWGTFAFSVGDGDAEPWSGASDANFIVPRWLYSSAAKRLTLCLLPDDDHAQIVEELETLLCDPPPISSIDGRLSDGHQEDWRTRINALVDIIRGGTVQKVVAARRQHIELQREPSPAYLIQRMHEKYRGCTVYGFDIGNGFFLGATPERLIKKCADGSVQTHALAGSALPHDAESLLTSEKDLEEHQYVRRWIEKTLTRHSQNLEIPNKPRLLRLPNIAHLETPVRASVNANTSIFELIRELHPTPAVGGKPFESALAWIEKHERGRGYYASPIGYVDADGSGDFAVALRCLLLRKTNAWAWVGAGIVQNSDADKEFAETEWKLAPVCDALGINL